MILDTSKTYITTKDFLVSGESFELRYDENLEMLKTFPVPKVEDLPKYYESQDYISHTDDQKGLMPWMYSMVKIWSLKKKVELIQKQNGGVGSVLDIGAGTGDFLLQAIEQGWETFGVEPNPNAIRKANEKGIIFETDLSAYAGRQFDVITLWHVLEHIPNLSETIDQLSKLVKPEGSLIVAVPNYKSYDANYYGKFWAAYDVPRHLWHFSQTSMNKIFQDHFRLEEIKPLYFDSFYVSLLSEKYKTGSKFSLKAFWIGWKSNMRARKNLEYSSLIYCFRR